MNLYKLGRFIYIYIYIYVCVCVDSIVYMLIVLYIFIFIYLFTFTFIIIINYSICWDVPHPDERVEWSFWMSSNDSKENFKKNFKEVSVALGNYILVYLIILTLNVKIRPASKNSFHPIYLYYEIKFIFKISIYK